MIEQPWVFFSDGLGGIILLFYFDVTLVIGGVLLGLQLRCIGELLSWERT